MLSQQLAARQWLPAAPVTSDDSMESERSADHLLSDHSIMDLRAELFKYRFAEKPAAGFLTGINTFRPNPAVQRMIRDYPEPLSPKQVTCAIILGSLLDEFKAYGWPSPGNSSVSDLAHQLGDIASRPPYRLNPSPEEAGPGPAGRPVTQVEVPLETHSHDTAQGQTTQRLIPASTLVKGLSRLGKELHVQLSRTGSGPITAAKILDHITAQVACKGLGVDLGVGASGAAGKHDKPPGRSQPTPAPQGNRLNAQAPSSCQLQPAASSCPPADLKAKDIAEAQPMTRQPASHVSAAAPAASSLRKGWLLPSASTCKHADAAAAARAPAAASPATLTKSPAPASASSNASKPAGPAHSISASGDSTKPQDSLSAMSHDLMSAFSHADFNPCDVSTTRKPVEATRSKPGASAQCSPAERADTAAAALILEEEEEEKKTNLGKQKLKKKMKSPAAAKYVKPQTAVVGQTRSDKPVKEPQLCKGRPAKRLITCASMEQNKVLLNSEQND